jgi:hypothetical protein
MDILPSEESEPLKCESWATCNLPGNNTDLIASQIEVDSTMAPSVRQQPPSELPTQEPSQSCQLLRLRPLLHITIPETERAMPWLDRHLCDSPLVCVIELPQPPSFY